MDVGPMKLIDELALYDLGGDDFSTVMHPQEFPRGSAE